MIQFSHLWVQYADQMRADAWAGIPLPLFQSVRFAATLYLTCLSFPGQPEIMAVCKNLQCNCIVWELLHGYAREVFRYITFVFNNYSYKAYKAPAPVNTTLTSNSSTIKLLHHQYMLLLNSSNNKTAASIPNRMASAKQLTCTCSAEAAAEQLQSS